jgi:predicted protein tyrosine phosphatase
MKNTVKNICAKEAEDILELDPYTCLISIGEEYGDFWDLKVNNNRVLKLRFSDVRAVTRHPKDDRWLKPMSRDQAVEIVNFVTEWQGFDFIVNCAAGVSRSGAIALFIHLFYDDYKLRDNFWLTSEPNPFILGMLTIEKLRK